ncbi:unnamed protein product [Schistosoma mattheei]|uniref:SP-RING-type domain-containing protein n=1 Tax=Schistosoma mattheei TaxID=31246 RepID=A0AA85ARV4_9TREM|nr:unnamed protein product [Schistosoma mattheei]
MSTPNLPNGTIRSGLPFELCRSDYSLPIPVISQASSLVSVPRNVFNAYPSTAQSRSSNVLQKPTVSNSTSNFPLVTTSNIAQSNANAFANYPAFNSIFQTLLRGTNPSQVTISPPNVSGYVNTVAGPNGNLFTGFRPTQLSYQPNIHITAPGIISSGSTHGTVNSVALRSTNCTTRNNVNSTSTYTTTATTTCNSLTTSRTVNPSVESLFVSSNFVSVSDSINRARKLGAAAFVRWAEACTRSFRKERISVWPRCKADSDALHEMNWIISPPGLLGIYSESPFLRPVVLLRRVQFTAPGNVNPNIPDTDNMVRSLREMADAKVTKYPGFAPQFPPSAASVGFTTDYMTYVFTLELERQVVKLLRPKTGDHSEWRVVLRLGWATTDFYVPSSVSSNAASHRALVLESLPRCLSIRVSGRPVPLPDPIFHGGQAQRLGKRLRLSIDITDKVLMKCGSAVRNRVVDIELTWLHVPLEDQSVGLLNLVADGLVSPLLCHLIGLPLVQVTLDRAYSVSDLRNTFNLENPEAYKNFINGPLLDPIEFPSLTVNADGSGTLEDHGVFGAYDNCLPPAFSLPADNTKHELKSRLQKSSNDSDLCFEDGDVELADYIPVCLLCPLTRTRIDLPVRSFNCSHLQCFDLHSYLTINMRRPRWSCPICSISAPFRDLRVDEFFMSILKNPRSVDVEFVQLDANGDWHLNNPNDVSPNSSFITESNQLKIEQKNVENVKAPITLKNLEAPNEGAKVTTDKLNESETNTVDINNTYMETTEQVTKDNHNNTNSNNDNCQLEPEVIILSDDDDDINNNDTKETETNVQNGSNDKSVIQCPQNVDKLKTTCNNGQKDDINNGFPCLNEKSTISSNTQSTRTFTLEIDLTNDDSDSSSLCEPNNRIMETPFTTDHTVPTNDIQQSDLSSDFIRTRDEIRFGSKDEFPDKPCSIASSSTITGRRNAHIIKQQQAAALARLIQERSTRIRSTSEASNEQNQQGIENLPSTSSSSKKVKSKKNTVSTQSNKKRPIRKRPRRLRPSNISDDSNSSSQSLYTSEMSCVSTSEPSNDSSFVNSSQCTDEDDDLSIDSFSSDDRWSPSHVSFNRKQKTKRKPKVRR